MLIELTASQVATVREALELLAQGGQREALIDALNEVSQSRALAILSERSRAEVGDERFDEVVELAREIHAMGSDDDIEIDGAPLLSVADDGVWVSGWLWVPTSDEGDGEDEEGEED